MPATIPCPECRRRLQLPEDFRGVTVRCPACGAQFSAETALPVALPATTISPSPDPKDSPLPTSRGDGWAGADLGRDDPERQQRPSTERSYELNRLAKRSSWKPWGIVLALVGAMVLITGIGVVGIVLAVRQTRIANTTRPAQVWDEDDGLPPDVRQALAHLRLGGYQEALDLLDRPGNFHPNLPIVELIKGMAFNGLNQHEKALKHLEAYRDAHGEDANVCLELSEALRGLGRFPEALQAARKSLDLDPTDADAFQGFLRSLAEEDNLDDVAVRFDRLVNYHENFSMFAEECEGRQFPALLEQLVQAMRKVDPNFAPVDFYDALVKVQLQQPAQAVRLYKSALEKEQDADKRQVYTTRFLLAMSAAGKLADAYAAVPEPRETFRMVASELLNKYQLDGLRELIAVHAKKYADDPLVPLYRAEVYVRECRYVLAEQSFAAALAKPPDEETLKPFRASRVEARYHTGQALSAYREIGPRNETFADLARFAFHDEKDDVLQALLDAHVQNEPGNIDVLCYRYRLKIRQGQVPEGVALFKEAMTKTLPDVKRMLMVTDFLSGLVDAGKPLEGYRNAPDARQAFQTLAEQLLENDRHEDLRHLLEAHRAAHPADPWLAYYQGEIYMQEKAWDKAVQVLGEGLKSAPKDLQSRMQWTYVFAAYKAGLGLKVYRETELRATTFSNLANLLVEDKKAEELQALIEAHRPHAGDSPELYRYESLAKVLQKQPNEAAVLLRKASEKQANVFLRKQYINRFLSNMEDMGQALEGYRLVADKRDAFETLAAQL